MIGVSASTPAPQRFCSPGLKKLILRLGLVSDEQISSVEAAEAECKIIFALTAGEHLDEDLALNRISNDLSIPLIDLSDPQVLQRARESDVFEKIEVEFGFQHRCVPVAEEKGEIVVAMADPLDTETLSALEFLLSASIKVTVAKEKEIVAVLSRLAGNQVFEEAIDEAVQSSVERDDLELKMDQIDDGDESEKAGSESAPVVRVVNNILGDGFEQMASDIHLEPTAKTLEVRFRIDGVMSSHLSVPKRLQNYVITRLKILSGMDITEKRRPQDGRFRVAIAEAKKGDIRASSVPTPFGEKLVLRLLRPDSASLGLEMLGLTEDIYNTFTLALAARDRMVVVTGPTGSGKSTTLYSAIHYLKKGTTNIITVEDPIEYRIDGITQIQVDQKVGMTFATGLRSILRQDPDIIMVGEIRDLETAEIGFQAAQTGHLVLSTLHTNTAVSAVVRLLDLGIEPFIIASSLGAVVAQRLVRKVCEACSRELNDNELKSFRRDYQIKPEKVRVTMGCNKCDQTGYRGRTGVYSLLTVSDQVRELIRQRASDAEIERVAQQEGMSDLFDAGYRLVEQGITSMEEVERVVGKGKSQKPVLEKSADQAANQRTIEGTKKTKKPKKAARDKQAKQSDPKASIASVEELRASFIDGAAVGRQKNASSLDKGAAAGSVADLATAYRQIEDEGVGAKKVLLVDDDEGVRVVMSRALRRAGFEVLEAHDGLDAIHKLVDFSPDIIISDLVMPRLDGEEFVLRLRKEDRTRKTPILIITGSDNEANEIRLIEAGANDFVSKLSSPPVVITRIKRLLGG